MILMRYLTPTLDNMFMESLAWVDRTYYQKHRGEDSTVLRKGYYENLSKYSTGKIKTQPKNNPNAIKKLLIRSVKSAGISLLIFTLSYLPVVGRFVLPTVSFYTFQKVTGFAPAAVIFGTSIFLPRKFLVIFLQSYFASRKLVRELLEPYFCRIRFNKEQKRNWFRDREGLLFGFGLGFYLFLRIPFFGVLIYGIAEASTAYLITKITDPPPPPDRCEGFAAGQQHWTNKVGFLKLNLGEIDQLTHRRQTTSQSEQRAFSSADLHATLNRGLSYVF
ncbi:putative transmembrane protein [Golovinomyces cichoracearum]|uniref:Putative transmembrane protein n=1 Tax=Golovinomyces cichoracearum TaxID=62708 RepID=A0A420J0L0_9PEZI|nr:putative transmembrane protein [Golovinomyces cichoracearum]